MKPIEEWTWDDLVAWCGWEVVRGITAGRPLNSVMYTVLTLAGRWFETQQAKKEKP